MFFMNFEVNAKDDRVWGLDGLRGLCVLAVFIEHFLYKGLGLGGLGVGIFFGLSGYLIVGILHRMRRQIEMGQGTPVSFLKLFWVGRVLRIFPAYYIVLVFCFFKYAQRDFVSTFSFQGLGYYFVFLGNFYIEYIGVAWGKFSHLWSLSVEQHFYMLASPLLLYLPSRNHRTAMLILLVLALAEQIRTAFALNNSASMALVGSLPNFACISCGALMALSWRGQPRLPRTTRPPDAAQQPSASAELLILFGLFGYLVSASILREWLSASWCYLIGSGSLLALCAGLLHVIPARAESGLVRFLNTPALRQLGTVSYGFYLYHYLFPDLAVLFEERGLFDSGWSWLGLPLQFVLTWGLATLSWHGFERRWLGLKSPARPA